GGRAGCAGGRDRHSQGCPNDRHRQRDGREDRCGNALTKGVDEAAAMVRHLAARSTRWEREETPKRHGEWPQSGRANSGRAASGRVLNAAPDELGEPPWRARVAAIVMEEAGRRSGSYYATAG